ncbi:MAG: tRNA (adenosine(37)-N6)-threonylcarbamoyltransferase complex dimerization subunit type 1 TsaB [Bacteroidales bacterium]
MTKILHIDTATPHCSVALSSGTEMLGLRETSEKNAHSRVVTTFADELMKSAGIEPFQLDAVAVSMGPGSYTGLRIGVSAAKGFCYALNKPLIGVNTLHAMAAGMRFNTQQKDALSSGLLFCPMIDARRMEVYTALFDGNMDEVRETKAEIITENSFAGQLENHRICFAGDGAAKSKAFLEKYSNALYLDDFVPSAGYMIPIALERFTGSRFEDVAYFEPFYLKDFIAGMPRVKGLA